MRPHPAPATGRAAAAVTLAACMAACMTAAAAERLVMTKLSQVYLPFETGSDGAPRFCYDRGVCEQIAYHEATRQVLVASSEVRGPPAVLCAPRR